MGLQNRQNNQRQPLLGLLQEDELHNHNIYAEGLGQTHEGSLVVSLVSVSPYEPHLVDSVGCVLIVSFIFYSFGSYHSSSLSSAGFPWSHLVFMYGFLSVAE